MAGLDGAGDVVTQSVVLERAAGVAGELVLRRTGGDLEVISNGTFLISAANEVSSRALVIAALAFLRAPTLTVLIGGLGLGYALEAALDEPRVASVMARHHVSIASVIQNPSEQDGAATSYVDGS